MKKRTKKVLVTLVGTFFLAGVACGGIIATIATSARVGTYSQISEIPKNHVAIVFGARVFPDGTLSPILRDRVAAAVMLYKSKKVDKLLMSGDNSRKHYDEVTAMKNYAVDRGIPAEDIILDYAGFSTYESCYRARAIFGLQRATLVTQGYHLPRALYTCRELGIDTIGLALPDFELYPNLRFNYSLREYAADIKAWEELHVTKPKPTYLGDPIAIP